MKQVKLYFGQQKSSVFGGSYADIIELTPIEDSEVENIIKTLTDKDIEWTSINLKEGRKYINIKNILWFDIIDFKQEEKENV